MTKDEKDKWNEIFRQITEFHNLQASSLKLIEDVESGLITWDDVYKSMNDFESDLIEKMK